MVLIGLGVFMLFMMVIIVAVVLRSGDRSIIIRKEDVKVASE
jgi:hypothetical protein